MKYQMFIREGIWDIHLSVERATVFLLVNDRLYKETVMVGNKLPQNGRQQPFCPFLSNDLSAFLRNPVGFRRQPAFILSTEREGGGGSPSKVLGVENFPKKVSRGTFSRRRRVFIQTTKEMKESLLRVSLCRIKDYAFCQND